MRDDSLVDLQALKYFVSIAEAGSFTEGALRAHIVQSAASAAVARLERELGTDLFDRSGRSIKITESGRLLLEHARVMLSAAQAARDDVDALTQGVLGVVTLGSILTSGSLDLAGALTTFRVENPRVRVHVKPSAAPTYAHFESLFSGAFDLLLAPQPPHLPPGIQMDPVAVVRLVAVCSTDHPLADVEGVTTSDLAAYDHIDFPLDWGNRQIVEHTFQARAIERRVAFEVFDVVMALLLAAGGSGVGFVGENVARRVEGVTVIDLAEPFPRVRIGLATATERPLTAAARGLRDAILKMAGARPCVPQRATR